MASSKSGDFGEQQAAEFLKKKGAKIFVRNYHSRFGEVDIIAQLQEFLLFVEVKTRNKNAIAAPREWVNQVKQQKIIRTAMQYLADNPTKLQPRFDVLEVILPDKNRYLPYEIYHLENAFDLGGIY